MKESFANRLKRIRTEKGYTQKQLAEIAQIAEHTLSNYEEGISLRPSCEILFELSKALDVTSEYLFLGDNNMNNYTQAIEKELEQIMVFNQIDEIKKSDYNATILSHLEMTEDLVGNIQKHWNDAGIFKIIHKITMDDGTVVSQEELSYCTKPYAQEIILKYCQNRSFFKNKFKLNDGMLLLNN